MNNMDIALFLLRLTVGLYLAGHGAQKLFGWFKGHGLRGTGAWLESQGFHPGGFWAVLAGLSEFGGGLLFTLGFLSPLGSIGIGSAMLVAITKAHWPKVWAADGGFEHPLINFVVALAVGLIGPGRYSLDAVWGTAMPSELALIVTGVAALGYIAGMIVSSANRPVVQEPQPAAQR
jgi:putative oxidoreductase